MTATALSADQGSGFFVGIGANTNSIAGEVNGTHAYLNTNSSSNQTIYDGKFDDGMAGLALLVGFAINPYVGVEVELENTKHKATNTVRNSTTDADFTYALIGGRLNLPLSNSWIAFVRGGFGGCVAAYKDFAVDNVTGQTNPVDFSGGGSAFGAGLEVRGTHLGLALDFTEHHFVLDSASTQNGSSGPISPRLHGIADNTTLLLLYYF
jgi:hypothetical protein